MVESEVLYFFVAVALTGIGVMYYFYSKMK